MFFEEVLAKDNKRQMIEAWRGYNHNEVIANGELYDTKNLTNDKFPLLSPRKKRAVAISLSDDEWNTENIDVTSHYYGDISSVYATYTFTKEVDEKSVGKIKYNLDISNLERANALIRFYEGNKELTRDAYETKDTECIVEYTTPAKCNRIEFTLTISPIDKEKFHEEDLNKYAHDFKLVHFVDDVRGILIKDSKLAYMISTVLYYDGHKIDFDEYLDEEDHTSKQQIISYGSYILIFPLGLYLHTPSLKYGLLSSRLEVPGSVTYQMCTKEGKNITATSSDTAPENPSEGAYWYCTKEESRGLYVWVKNLAMWQSVATTYIAIRSEAVDFTQYFKEGDAVFMTSPIDDINNGSIIRSIDTHSIVVSALINETITSDGLVLERRIPTLDYVCVSNNRVWGCHKDDEVNEIYASKLGDATNWYVYDGIASDSYALSLGDDGVFTGCISFKGFPYFFKENIVYQIYGSYPATYQLNTYDCRGVQKGSSNSLAVVGEYLMYKSVTGVCVFDGYNPTVVSSALGTDFYSKASAGSAGSKYYISMHNDTIGEWETFVYDIDKYMWMKEDNLHIEEFTSNHSNELYGHNGIKVYGFEMAASTFNQSIESVEDTVEWMATTGLFGLDRMDQEWICRFNIRADIPLTSDLEVEIAYDDGEFEPLKTARKSSRSTLISFNALRCDRFRIRLKGHGDVAIYNMSYSYDVGSEDE